MKWIQPNLNGLKHLSNSEKYHNVLYSLNEPICARQKYQNVYLSNFNLSPEYLKKSLLKVLLFKPMILETFVSIFVFKKIKLSFIWFRCSYKWQKKTLKQTKPQRTPHISFIFKNNRWMLVSKDSCGFTSCKWWCPLLCWGVLFYPTRTLLDIDT